MEIIVLIAASISYLTTVLVLKDGPSKIFLHAREWIDDTVGEKNNPFNCFVCASFWICVFILLLDALFPEGARIFYTLFGILGISLAIRGISNEY